MAKLNTTQFVRQVMISKSLKKIQSELTQNITQARKLITGIQVNMTKDLQEMQTEIQEDISAKISVGNFTKLVTDAQGVVNELYRMVSCSAFY